MEVDVLLQCAIREPDKVLIQDVRKGYAPLCCQRMTTRHHHNQAV